jgi:hypothetical protein
MYLFIVFLSFLWDETGKYYFRFLFFYFFRIISIDAAIVFCLGRGCRTGSVKTNKLQKKRKQVVRRRSSTGQKIKNNKQVSSKK